MPAYKGHLIGGTLVGVTCIVAADYFAFYQASPTMSLCLLAVTITASIFPDIDTHSKGRPWVYGAFLLTSLYLCSIDHFREAAFLGMMAMLPCLGGHRGWTHAWWAMILVPLPLLGAPMYFFGWEWQTALPWYIAGLIGYATHLIMDKTM